MSNNVSKPARTTPPVRVSYPNVFTPRAFQPGQDAKYSVVLMFEKENPEHKAFLGEIYKDVEQALAEKWPDAAKRPRVAIIGGTNSPIKDGDATVDRQGIPIAEKNPEYAGHYIIRAATTSKPIVVDRNMAEVLDQSEVYGGCYCKVNVNCYTYDMQANKGVTFGLNGVQKWKDGESFGGGRPPVSEMFSAEAGEDNPANYASADPFAGGEDAGQAEAANPFA